MPPFIIVITAQDLQFKTTIEVLIESGLNGTYGFNMGTGKFNGLIGVLQRNEADIAIQVSHY